MTFRKGVAQEWRKQKPQGWHALGTLRAREMREWFAICQADGVRVADAAEEFGCSYNAAWRCLSGDSYRDAGGQLCYLQVGRLVFSDNQVRAIRRIAASRVIKQRELAKRLGVNEYTISKIVNRHSYAWVD